MRRLGIYVQVPFCQTKCTYCNFHTGVVKEERFAPYVEAVEREIAETRETQDPGEGWEVGMGKSAPLTTKGAAPELCLDTERQTQNPGITEPESCLDTERQTQDPPSNDEGGAPESWLSKGKTTPRETQDPGITRRYLGHPAGVVDTLYIGGGTPSLLEVGLLRRIVEAVRKRYRCELREVTLEADPETIEEEKAREWIAAGINRISLGTQSFADEELKAAGRMHRRADIYRAVPTLRAAGFENISFDLIAGMPKQTRESWEDSLKQTVELGAEHVSIYMMEIDEGSRLGLEVLQGGARYSAKDLPTEEAMADFYERAQEVLKGAGYGQYEISNWAKPGRESLHNLKYWRREAYTGFGAGAHSFSAGRSGGRMCMTRRSMCDGWRRERARWSRGTR